MSSDTFEQMMWDSMIVKPESSTIPHPKTKRKGTTLDRESMKTRNSLGYPGSRRHRYWMNEFFLLELNKAVTGSQEVEWIDDSEWFFPAKPPSALRTLHEDPAAMKSFSAFIDITEEEQDRLLGAYSGEESCSVQVHLSRLAQRGYNKCRRAAS